jgi:VIT1/CCC1 family predicted Fe2+/Mn2+ transporter
MMSGTWARVEKTSSPFGRKSADHDQSAFQGIHALNPPILVDEAYGVGSAWRAAYSSFGLFASGAAVPVLPYLFGASGLTAIVIAAALVGIALLGTGAVVGLLSGASPLKRALRQLGIGYGAAAATCLLGRAFGATVS